MYVCMYVCIMYLFIYLFICSFVYSFVRLFVCLEVEWSSGVAAFFGGSYIQRSKKTSRIAEVGHRRPFFCRHVVVLLCGWDVAAPRVRRRSSGARESPLFGGSVLLPARRSAAVRMGRGGTARPPEVEWSSGVAAFLGGCYNQDIFEDPKKRHDHLLSVLYNKDY